MKKRDDSENEFQNERRNLDDCRNWVGMEYL